MFGIKQISKNPAEQRVKNFMSHTNAYAEQSIKRGNKAEFISAGNAKDAYGRIIKAVVSFANPASNDHNKAYNAISSELGKNAEALNDLESVGSKFRDAIFKTATELKKTGLDTEKAIEAAFNSQAGNPGFDHFANLNNLSEQLYQNSTFLKTFLEYGDSFTVPREAGGTNQDKSRFRVPVESVYGSAKVSQGDINPNGSRDDDNNRIQISLQNEFKNAETLSAIYSITQEQRDQFLGYQEAVSPTLAGFILQNRYAPAAEAQIEKLAETQFVDGLNSVGDYIPNVGGSYGLLSPSIQLQLGSWNQAAPSPATGSDWTAAPTKLIQKIQNFYAKPASTAAQLPANLDPTLVYKDIVRLFSLPAINNVEYDPRDWVLYVPTSWYALAVQYPSSGTFNKQLTEMVHQAIGNSVIKSIKIMPSSLLNYRATNSYGSSAGAYNYMVAVAQGSPAGKKSIILPGETAAPVIYSDNVSATIMNFRAVYPYGGPMITQYGGVYILEFSAQA